MKVIALFLLLFSDLTWKGEEQQGVQITATLEKSHLPVDDWIRLELNIVTPPEYTLDLPLLKQEMVGDANVVAEKLEVIAATAGEATLLSPGKKKQSFSFIFNPLVTGKYPLSLQRIPFAKDKELFYYTGPLWIVEVEPVPFHPEEAKELVAPFLPIKQGPLYTLTQENQTLLQRDPHLFAAQAFPLKTVLVLVFFGGIFIILWYYEEPFKKYILHRLFPPPDPHQALLQQLKNSFDTDEWGGILKKTLELQWKKPATRWTTQEIICHFSPEKRATLAATLQKLDALRYGKLPLTQEEQEKLHLQILELIEY